LVVISCGKVATEAEEAELAKRQASHPAEANEPVIPKDDREFQDGSESDEPAAPAPVDEPTANNPVADELTSFQIVSHNDQIVSKQTLLNWQDASSSPATSYQLILAASADCQNVVYDFTISTNSEYDLQTVTDGSYYICLEASLDGQSLAASNSGMLLVLDTTPPPALAYFELETIRAAKPDNTSADKLGSLALSISFPGDTTDYHLFALKYQEGSLDSCSSGQEYPLVVSDFTTDLQTEIKLSPGKSYAFRVCIDDKAGNRLEQALTSNRSTPGAQRMFISSQAYTGNFMLSQDGNDFVDGLSGADYRCQALADGAQLQGKWSAVLSDDQTNAKDRIQLYQSVIDVSGGALVNNASDLWLGLDYPLGLNESGVSAGASTVSWTGTISGGTARAATHCANWSSGQSSSDGGIGLAGTDGDLGLWLAGPGFFNKYSCNNTATLYCIEQAQAP